MSEKKEKGILTQFIQKLYKIKKELFVLQIGAMDGKTFDDIYPSVKRYKMKGLFIEPLPDMFEKLKYNYRKQEGLIFENCAIAENDKPRIMYRVVSDIKKINPRVPEWIIGCGTIVKDKNPIFKKNVTDEQYDTFKNHIIEQEVKCSHLYHILEKHGIDSIDIVSIDAEGYDYNILKQLNLEKYSPYIIKFEHFSLTNKEAMYAKMHLEDYGYSLMPILQDTIAFKNFIFEND
jgi:FkbM family methyltransferase